MDTGTYYSLNQVATTFWEMLDGQATIAELASRITHQYNQSTADFVGELRVLAQESGTGDRGEQEESLAERYGVGLTTVSDSLPLLVSPKANQHAADLLATHSIELETVTADLLELALELESEKLVEVTGS
jgi:hypothetical protein